MELMQDHEDSITKCMPLNFDMLLTSSYTG